LLATFIAWLDNGAKETLNSRKASVIREHILDANRTLPGQSSVPVLALAGKANYYNFVRSLFF